MGHCIYCNAEMDTDSIEKVVSGYTRGVYHTQRKVVTVTSRHPIGRKTIKRDRTHIIYRCQSCIDAGIGWDRYLDKVCDSVTKFNRNHGWQGPYRHDKKWLSIWEKNR
jgi:hypothetical protein